MLLAIIVFSNLITIYTKSYASFKRINKLLNIKVEQNVNSIKNIEKYQLDIRNVNFSYDNSYIIKDLNLKINEGEIFGVLGKAGSGKTTILNLINKSYEVENGEILIGNVNVKQIDKNILKDNILLISQKLDFFRESIKENIILGKENINNIDVIKALKLAKAWDFIEKLPNRYRYYIRK